MIGDDAVARPMGALGGDPGRLFRGADQRLEQVDVVIVVLALQHRGDALQPHAGVDRGPRQDDPFVLRDLLVLHEDEIPDLDEAVAVLVGAAGRTAGNALAVVVEDLRAGSAGTGVAHRPEIVAGGDADDALVGEPGDLLPEGGRLVVGVIDGDQEARGREAEIAGEQPPGELDGALLEIVAEGEIAEHLEEGVVARGVADIVEVVVLAAGAHAFLRGDRLVVGSLLQPGEDVLELHHPGIGEHERRVVARNERARGDDGMSVLAEELEKGRPDLVDATHGNTRSLWPLPACPAAVMEKEGPPAAETTAPFIVRPGRCPETGRGRKRRLERAPPACVANAWGYISAASSSKPSPPPLSRNFSAISPAFCRSAGLDLACQLGIFPQEQLGVLATLAEALRIVGEPGAGLLHHPGLDAEIDELAGLGHALAIHDVELDHLERRCQLVLHHLDARLVADHLVAVLDRADAADVEAHRGVELQRIAARGGLRRAEHDADLHADLVDEDDHRVGARDGGGELAQGLAHQAGLQAGQRIAHLALDLGARRQRGDRIDHQNVDGAGAHQRVADLESLLAGVGLRDQQVLQVDPQLAGIDRVQRMLGVDEGADAALALRLGHRMERQRGLAGALRTVDLDDAAARQAADAERDVQAQGAGGHGGDLHHLLVLPEPHDRALAEGALDLRKRGVERL